MGDFGKFIYCCMSKYHISVSPQILTKYLIILDIKIISHYKFTLKKLFVNIIILLLDHGLSPYDTVPPLLMFGHVTYQGFH